MTKKKQIVHNNTKPLLVQQFDNLRKTIVTATDTSVLR